MSWLHIIFARIEALQKCNCRLTNSALSKASADTSWCVSKESISHKCHSQSYAVLIIAEGFVVCKQSLKCFPEGSRKKRVYLFLSPHVHDLNFSTRWGCLVSKRCIISYHTWHLVCLGKLTLSYSAWCYSTEEASRFISRYSSGLLIEQHRKCLEWINYLISSAFSRSL